MEVVTVMTVFQIKGGILIYLDASRGACTSEANRQEFYNQGYRDMIFQEVSNTTTCETFNRYDATCAVYRIQNNPNGNVACAIGFDNYIGSTIPNDISFYETSEILESALQ